MALAACACVGAIVVLQQSSTGDVVAALSAVNVATHLGSSRDCFLAYCNAHGDLRNALCDGGICSSDTHLTRCTDHWRRHGKSEGRHSNPEQCMLTADGQMRTMTGLKTSDVMASLSSGMKPGLGPDARALGAPVRSAVGTSSMASGSGVVHTQGRGKGAGCGEGGALHKLMS